VPEKSLTRRVIEVKESVIGPPEPRLRRVRETKLSDYPQVSAAHKEVARKLSSPLLLGPPICDELIAFVRHLLTEEEAGIVRHLSFMRPKSAEALAKAEGRRVEEIEPIVQRLALEKRCIAGSGPDHKRRYGLMPIMPGIFEMVLIGESPETLTDWHRRFAELFEALYETGYGLDYFVGADPMVRFLSVGTTVGAHPMALPSDRLEVVLDQFKTFAVGHCQCRMAETMLGRGCGKPLENCTAMGMFAERGIRDGWARSVSRQALLDIKREAEANGLVTWIMNVASAKGQASCSCCGCCCHAMRVVSEFNAPGMMAPAHFMPVFDLARCTFCGKCARACPMAALRVDMRGKTHQRLVERCIGCGLCVPACDMARAVTMEPVPDYKLPYKSWFSMLARTTPRRLTRAWKVWRKRR
jgi:Pyruvate/2-oxoacid:ferredoxin oxidoreductase delta subunit